MHRRNLRDLLPFVVIAILFFTFFSFRLGDVPNGINLDEASYGHNGILLAQDFRDQHGRRFPIFILGSDNKTWYAPYMQYLVALIFKIFGASIFNLRMSSVIVTTVSAILIYCLAKLLFTKKGYYPSISLIAFAVIPEVMIETHTPLEHMIVVPFTLIWLISLFKYMRYLENKYLIIAALGLGTGFYSYAGIRPFVAVWVIATLIFIIYLSIGNKRGKFLVNLLSFTIPLFPFFAIIPILEFYYAGAVLNGVSLKINSIYEFIYYYISNFDFSFLFVRGDKLLVQSTLKYGMFLVSTLPIFLAGIYISFRKKNLYFIFLAVVFLATPILYGFVSSSYFAHRLLYMAPFYVIFITSAAIEIIENKNKFIKYLGGLLLLLVLINYADFWHYYLFVYPKDTANIFHHIEKYEQIYKEFKEEADKKRLRPYISKGITPQNGTNNNDPELFAEAIYFPKPPTQIENEQLLPKDGVLLTEKNNLKGLVRLNLKTDPYFVYVAE